MGDAYLIGFLIMAVIAAVLVTLVGIAIVILSMFARTWRTEERLESIGCRIFIMGIFAIIASLTILAMNLLAR